MTACVGVMGAGAWGTALAAVAARAGRHVLLAARDPQVVAAINERHENPARLPGVRLAETIRATVDMSELAACDPILSVVPAQATRSALLPLRDAFAGHTIVACAKGVEAGTGLLQSEVIAEILPEAGRAALSGPGFAGEVAAGLPTAVTLAAMRLDEAGALAKTLSSSSFRPYASDDLVGVELGGALKNVLAIAAGVVEGRGLGESARAALVARGLAEMTRLGSALGARPATLAGLSGLGDLVLTAMSGKSRNARFGMALGRGQSVADLLAEGQPLAEGASTAAAALRLAKRHAVDVPVTAAVADLVDGRRTVDQCIEDLVNRPLKPEG